MRHDPRAACRAPEVEPEWFFPHPGESSAAAKAVCRRCDIRRPCLDWALAEAEQHGVYGGQTPGERAWEAKRRAERRRR